MTAKHPALSLDEKRRIDYLSAVASIVYADENVAESELGVIRDLCGVLELSEEGTARVIDATRHKPEWTQAVFDELRHAGLGVPLVTDAIIVAFADGRLTLGETKGLAAMAHLVGVTTAQIALIARFVDAEVGSELPSEPGDGQLARELAEALAKESVPSHGHHPVRWLYEHLARKSASLKD